MRGKRDISYNDKYKLGITPAHAGKTVRRKSGKQEY